MHVCGISFLNDKCVWIRKKQIARLKSRTRCEQFFFFFGNKYKTVKYNINRLAADVQFVQYNSFFFWYSVKKYWKKMMHSFVTINIFFNI